MFFFQAEDGIRDLVRSRGLGDVYKRQALPDAALRLIPDAGHTVHLEQPTLYLDCVDDFLMRLHEKER